MEEDTFLLNRIVEPLLVWYDKGRRILPWREQPTPYHVWVSEIMLQQTRVEAVKPYYDRFMQMLPDIRSLAEVEEERLLKLWEGLGYYNRARNLKKAAEIIVADYDGQMPETYEELMKLPGIGSYTAGAIASIAFTKRNPAVDGNVLRILSRLRLDERNILDGKVKKEIEAELSEEMPKERPGDFNQAMMELGAVVCIPNGAAKCDSCPLAHLCMAKAAGRIMEFPKKEAKKPRSVEEKTVLVILDEDKVMLHKREKKGLLAGMYEFPSIEGIRTARQVIAYVKAMGLSPLKIEKLPSAKHIFTHKEWHMAGFWIRVDELEQMSLQNGMTPEDNIDSKERLFFAAFDEIEEKYPVPSAFHAYMPYADGKRKPYRNKIKMEEKGGR